MSNFLTTSEASKRAKVSRPTISRALKAGEIQGHRANAVHEQGKDSDSERLNAEVDAMRAEISDLREKLARRDGEASANKERISDLMTERDRLLTLLETRPVSFWGRFFGRS